MHPDLLKAQGLASQPLVVMLVQLGDGRRLVMHAPTTYQVELLFGRAASIQRTLAGALLAKFAHLPQLYFDPKPRPTVEAC